MADLLAEYARNVYEVHLADDVCGDRLRALEALCNITYSDRCLQLADAGPLYAVPPALQRHHLPLQAFAPPAAIAGLAEAPPIGLWLDPRQLPAELWR